MPYINANIRERIDPLNYKKLQCTHDASTLGELNYQITRLILHFMNPMSHGGIDGEGLYARATKVIGVLETAKLELYRRVLAPHEDIKKKENGDVYPK